MKEILALLVIGLGIASVICALISLHLTSQTKCGNLRRTSKHRGLTYDEALELEFSDVTMTAAERLVNLIGVVAFGLAFMGFLFVIA